MWVQAKCEISTTIRAVICQKKAAATNALYEALMICNSSIVSAFNKGVKLVRPYGGVIFRKKGAPANPQHYVALIGTNDLHYSRR